MSKISQLFKIKDLRDKILVVAFLLLCFIFLADIANAEGIANFPPVFEMPGTIEGIGTHFEITDSEYLNVSLESSEPIKLRMESIPEMIMMMIEPSVSSTISTQITLSGFNPLTKYYKYEDDYHNLTEFITDENGSYSYFQDLSKPHFVFIQPRKGTKFIKDDATGGDCYLIGNWNSTTKTCTLITDLNETVQIDSNNITFDGNGHWTDGYQAGLYMAGIYIPSKSGVTIKNINVKNFHYGIYLPFSASSTVLNNVITDNTNGISLTYSNNNNISNNIINRSSVLYFTGIGLYESHNNIIESNNVAGSYYNVGIGGSIITNNIFRDNTVTNSAYGIYLQYFLNNQIYNNNFIDNTRQIFIYWNAGENVFNLEKPIGGNYWNNFDTPAEGCSDLNNDNFCDSPYYFSGGQDNLPWTKQDGWKVPANQPPTISDFNQYKSDGATPINESAITAEDIIVFKATVQDQDNDQVKLQVELKEYNQQFNEQDIIESDFVSSGSEAIITRYGLIDGQYKWRVRVIDLRGGVSEWQEFGTAGNVDFKIKTVPLYTQVRSPFPSDEETREWFDEQYGTGKYSCFDKEFNRSTIRSCGCAITSELMIMRFHGITTAVDNNDVNPSTYNTWLTNNNGYNPNGDIKWGKIFDYSKEKLTDIFGRLQYKGAIGYKDTSTLDLYLSDLNPVILYEKVIVQGEISSHFIVADGKLSNTYTVKDPAWYNTRYLNQSKASYVQNYNNYFYGLRLFSPTIAGVDSISLHLASPAELLVTDPQGRKLGKDPINNISYNEIPNASYYQEGIGNPFPEEPISIEESKNIWIADPIDGKYDIKIIGTDPGTYSLGFLTYNNIGESTDVSFEAVTNIGVISNYSIDYSSIPEEPTIIERIINIQDVITEIEIGRQLNLIDNNGIKNSLIKKLDNAQRQIELNRKNTATNILNAFINEVEAQKGKYINLNFAELLIDDAQYIIEHFYLL